MYKGQLLVYSVPRLEHMYTVSVTISSPRFVRTWHRQTSAYHLVVTCYRSLSIDENGDYVDRTIRDGIAHKCELGTLFGLRRKTLYYDKVLDILRDKNKLPAQPQPVSMGPATLLGQMYAYVGGQSTTGVQIDALREYTNLQLPSFGLVDDFAHLVAGPNRPIPQPKETTPTSPGSSQSYGDQANTIASGANDLYSRLGNAMSERGQMLDGLEDTVNSLRVGSENMVAQVGLRPLPILLFHPLTARIGEEACCGTVDAKMVQLLIHSTLGGGCTIVTGERFREWKDLRNGRLAFSCTFFRGDGRIKCGCLVDEAR